MVIALLLFLSLYVAINGYVFSRAWTLLLAGHLPGILYILIAVLLAASYIAGTLLNSRLLKLAGSFWLTGMVYCLILFILIDLYRLILAGNSRVSPWLPAAGLVCIALLLVYGYFNARSVRIVDYTLPVAAAVPELTIVAVSDIHLGDIIGLDRYEKMIGEINALQPDMVLILGDVFDGSLKNVDTEKFAELSRQIQSRYGVYGVLGNHDQYAGPEELVVPPFTAGGIMLLIDEMISPCPGLYLAGGRPVNSSKDSAILQAFAAQAETDWPIILMDHIPSRIAAAREAGILLTLSGHTHHGQFVPVNLITSLIFENSHGHQTVDGAHSIVTSGYGTWGPPVRIGTHAEILRIQLRPAAAS
jgi:predicted MPP superfamily phosphohydrolase